MGTYADNKAYLSVDGVEMDSYFKTVELTTSNATQDVTAGSNSETLERAAGLFDYKLTVDMLNDDSTFATYITHLRPGASVAVVYGKFGSTSGKPKHAGNFIISTLTTGADNVDKTAPVLHFEADANGTPSTNMFSGGTWS